MRILPLYLCLFSFLWMPLGNAQQPPKGEPQAPPPRTLPEPPPVTPAPPPKIIPPEQMYETSDGHTSLKLFYWFAQVDPTMMTGKAAATNVDSTVSFAGTTKPTPGVELSVPAGKNNSIRISYFRSQGSGNSNAVTPPNTRGEVVWGANLSPGDYLSTSYKIQSAKISLDYLSWPFPLENRRFRFKTLWEVQYLNINSSVAAPYAPITDSSGNDIQTSGSGSNWFIWPSFGVGVEIMATKHFRF